MFRGERKAERIRTIGQISIFNYSSRVGVIYPRAAEANFAFLREWKANEISRVRFPQDKQRRKSRYSPLCSRIFLALGRGVSRPLAPRQKWKVHGVAVD